jgi:hypothetical protein
VWGKLLAEVGAADVCDEVAGLTAAVVLVLDPVGIVVGAVLELLVVDVVSWVGDAVWLRLNCGSLPSSGSATVSRPMVDTPAVSVSSRTPKGSGLAVRCTRIGVAPSAIS